MFSRIRAGRRPLVPLSADTRRSLIWTPDASRALALLGNTRGASGQTWHLPIDPDLLTYRELIGIASEVMGRTVAQITLPRVAFRIGGLLDRTVRESEELLPRYRQDNVFDSSRFRERFPDFAVTSYRDGITEVLAGARSPA